MAKFTAQQMIDALEATGGNVSAAADRVGCSRTTFYRYINDYATVKEAHREHKERTLDRAEQTLEELAIDERNVTALIFLLKTQGKSRGYVTRQELSGPGGDAVKIKVIETNVSDDEL